MTRALKPNTPERRRFALKVAGSTIKRVHGRLRAERENWADDKDDLEVADAMMEALAEVYSDHQTEVRVFNEEQQKEEQRRAAVNRSREAGVRPGRDSSGVLRDRMRQEYAEIALQEALKRLQQERAVLLAEDHKPLAEVNGINRAIDVVARMLGMPAENYKEPDYAE